MEFAYGSRISGEAGVWKELAGKRVLFITQPEYEKNGCVQRLKDRIRSGDSLVFDRVGSCATAMAAAEATGQMKNFCPHCVLGVGGRAAVETAKAAVYFSKMPVPLVLVPGLEGCCSAAGNQAVLTHCGGTRRLMGEQLLPHRVVLTDMAAKRPAEAGFEIMACCLEAMGDSPGWGIGDALAKDAFAAVFALLPACCSEGRGLDRLMQAGVMAGVAACQTGSGLLEAMVSGLCGRFQLSRGSVCAALLPAFLQSYGPWAEGKLTVLARAAGFGGSTPQMVLQNLKNGILRLRRELELPKTLAQAGISPVRLWDHCDTLVAGILADPCSRTGMLPGEDFVVRRILSEAAGNV